MYLPLEPLHVSSGLPGSPQVGAPAPSSVPPRRPARPRAPRVDARRCRAGGGRAPGTSGPPRPQAAGRSWRRTAGTTPGAASRRVRGGMGLLPAAAGTARCWREADRRPRVRQQLPRRRTGEGAGRGAPSGRGQTLLALPIITPSRHSHSKEGAAPPRVPAPAIMCRGMPPSARSLRRFSSESSSSDEDSLSTMPTCARTHRTLHRQRCGKY